MEVSSNTERCAEWRAANAEHMRKYWAAYGRANYEKIYARRKDSLARGRAYKRMAAVFLSILL